MLTEDGSRKVSACRYSLVNKMYGDWGGENVKHVFITRIEPLPIAIKFPLLLTSLRDLFGGLAEDQIIQIWTGVPTYSPVYLLATPSRKVKR